MFSFNDCEIIILDYFFGALIPLFLNSGFDCEKENNLSDGLFGRLLPGPVNYKADETTERLNLTKATPEKAQHKKLYRAQQQKPQAEHKGIKLIKIAEMKQRHHTGSKLRTRRGRRQ